MRTDIDCPQNQNGYCARAGENYIYSSDNIDEVGWYKGNSEGQTHPVGQKKPNGFGLYDMSGNIAEWVMASAQREQELSKTDSRFKF